MATFPASLDTLTNPAAGDPTSAAGPVPHHTQHSDANDAIEALEAKLGAGATLPTAGKALIGGSAAGSIWDRIGRKNLVINGDMSVAQRRQRASAVSSIDMSYQTVDRWKTLYSGAGTAWNLMAYDIGAGGMGYGASQYVDLLQSAGNSGKVGKLYILENIDTIPLRGQAVSLQANIFASTASIGDIRMALLSWSGTADSPTDPVSAWNADGTNPTLAASWAYINTPANLNATSIASVKKLENQTVPTSCNNLAIMIWCEDSVNSAGNSWFFTDVQLELGVVCTAVERIPFAQQFLMCQRYWQTSYPYQVTPGTATVAGEVLAHASNAIAASTAGNIVLYGVSGTRFGVPMRVTPTVVIYDAGNGVAGSAAVGGTTHRTGCTAGDTSSTTALGYLNFDNTSAVAIGDRQQIQIHYTAGAEL